MIYALLSLSFPLHFFETDMRQRAFRKCRENRDDKKRSDVLAMKISSGGL